MTVTGSVAYNSNHPEDYGWPAPEAMNVNYSFSWTSPQGITYKFPQGVAAGCEALISAGLDIIAAQSGFECYPDNDPNVCGMWGQESRQSANSSDASIHSWGLVCDLNAPWNPNGSDVPAAGPYRVPLNAGDLTYGLGMRWGGDWADWMHVCEIHYSPAQVDQWNQDNAGGYTPPPTNGDDDVTDDDIQKIATKVWQYMVGDGGAGATLEEVRSTNRDMNAKLSKLVDPRNGNVDGTG